MPSKHESWILLLVVSLLVSCYGQNQTAPPWPKERGIILAVFHDYGSPQAAQVRHLPMFPGFESFRGSIRGVGFQNQQIQFLSVDVDFRNRSAYFYDYHLRSIVLCTGYNADLNLTNMEFDFMHVGVSRGTVQLAVDWLSHTVYWSDSVYRWIIAAPGQKEKIDMDYYNIIVDDHLEAPDGLAVDPISAYLFWSDNGQYPKIERSDLIGNNRQTIITQNLVSPISLEADWKDGRIYWLDSYTESVLSAKYDGTDVTMVTRVPSSTLLDLATFRDVVYVTDIKNGNLITVNKTGGTMEATVLNIKPETIYGIGVYGEEKQPLKNNTDYCAKLNCEHLCFTIADNAQCVCSEGYNLNATTGKCDESYNSAHKAILFANSSHLCSVDIRSFASFSYSPVCFFTVVRSTPGFPTTSGPGTTIKQTETTTAKTSTPSPIQNGDGGFIKMFDLYMENRIAYIVTRDNSIYSRLLDLPLSSDVVGSIVKASGNVSGLAFDAVNGANLFWSESDTGSIYVVNVKNRAVKKVNPDNMPLRSPRNLIVLPVQRKLAWIAGSGISFSIQTMDLDGSNLIDIVTGQPPIDSLIFDKEKKLFYYMVPSRQQVLNISLNNPGVPVALPVTTDSTATLLVHYKNYFAWVYTPTSQYTHLIKTYEFTANKQNAHGFFDNVSIPVDIKVLDSKLQTIDKISPCAVKINTSCEHICITKYTNNVMTAVCECRLGYTLNADQKSCKTTMVNDNFFLVSDWTHNTLQQINLQDHSINAFPNNDSGEYYGVFYDGGKKRVLWSMYQDRRIYSANLNGTDKKILAEIGVGGYPYRFARDNTTGNLYYTAYYTLYQYHVGFVTPGGKIFKIVENTGYYSYAYLNSIAVHPGKGWVYYAVKSYGTSSYIGRCDMDGKNKVQLIYGSYIGFPDGLTIDYIHDHLYWSDADHDTIQRCDLEGKNCTTIVNIPSTDSEQIRDLATDGNYLYYSAYKKDHVVRVTLTAPYIRTVVGQDTGLGKLDTMTYYSSTNLNIQPVGKACQERGGLGDCSTICVPTSSGRTCMCEDGVQLKPDGRTCSNIYQCKDLIRQQDNTDIQITLDVSCLRFIGETCSYRCPPNYYPVDSGRLKCLNVGWDNETLPLCKEMLCSARIGNGTLDSSCKREVGEVCNFTCNDGFVKTMETTFCTKDGTFHMDSSELCSPFRCSDTIAHGRLDSQCSRNVGVACNFTCDPSYNSSLSSVFCQKDGWNINTNTLCKASGSQSSQCADNTLLNGQLSASCSKGIGEVCDFTCASNFINTTSKVICTSDLNWQPPDACKPFLCSNNIANGLLDAQCSRNVNVTCSFTCVQSFVSTSNRITCQKGGWNVNTSTLCTKSEMQCADKTLLNGQLSSLCTKGIGEVCDFRCSSGFMNTTPKVVCASDMTWHPLDACKGFHTTVSQVQFNTTSMSPSQALVTAAKLKSEKSGIPEGGVVAGFVVLAIAVIGLIALIVFLIRRSMTRYNSSLMKASFHNHHQGEIAIENPGYLQSELQPSTLEGPYSSVASPVGETLSDETGGGFENPIYGRDSMRGEGHIDLNTDIIVHTTDSEQKGMEYRKLH